MKINPHYLHSSVILREVSLCWQFQNVFLVIFQAIFWKATSTSKNKIFLKKTLGRRKFLKKFRKWNFTNNLLRAFSFEHRDNRLFH